MSNVTDIFATLDVQDEECPICKEQTEWELIASDEKMSRNGHDWIVDIYVCQECRHWLNHYKARLND